MDIMELGAIGELVGGLAVIASLLYVGAQIRHANRLAEDSASKVYTDLMSEIQGRIAGDRELAETWYRAADDFTGLDAVDQQRLIFFEWRAIDAWHHAFLMRERGILGEAEWHKMRGMIAYVAPRQSLRATWTAARDAYPENFQTFFDSCFAGAQRHARGA